MQDAANQQLTSEGTDDHAPAEPFGAAGLSADRDNSGRFVVGNRAALIVGGRSAAFWGEHEAARREIAGDVMADAGHSANDAPRALQLAADAIAQAVLLQRSAFDRLVESGGPLTSTGRTRRAFVVWQVATDRLERHLRLVGLRRLPKAAPSLADYLASLTQDGGDEPATTFTRDTDPDYDPNSSVEDA